MGGGFRSIPLSPSLPPGGTAGDADVERLPSPPRGEGVGEGGWSRPMRHDGLR
jgi:hypothetical protein